MLRITIEQERVNLEKSSGELLSDLQNVKPKNLFFYFILVAYHKHS